jgi:hypothetical protein
MPRLCQTVGPSATFFGALAAVTALAVSAALRAESPAPGGAGPRSAKPAVTGEAEWPQFHGPNRDNGSPETGLLKTWPEGGPKLLWTYSDCGKGFASVSIAAGAIYTTGDFGQDECVLALDLDGTLRWKAKNGAAWRGEYPGSRSTPTVDGDRVYQMNAVGRLAALRAESGEEVWAVDLVEAFGARRGRWALAESVTIDGQRLLCLPGGKDALMVALDKATGRTVWTCRDLDDSAAYCSPRLVTHGGRRLAITLTRRWIVAVDAAEGKLLWKHPHPTPMGQNVNTPVFHDGHVFVTGAHHRGGLLLRIHDDAAGATEVWFRQDLDNCHGGTILLGGRLYGSGCRLGGKRFYSADFRTGRDRGTAPDLGLVSLASAEGRLYALGVRGRVTLLEPRAEDCRIVGQFDLPTAGPSAGKPRPPGSLKDPCFAHPVVCGGRLYIRHAANLYAYGLRAGAGEDVPWASCP